MFGWFAPKCPVRTREKTWTERRILWLIERFGFERLRLAEVILPTEDYFPERYRGTTKDARRIFERLCDWMEIDAARLRLQVCEDFQLPESAAHYDSEGQPIIRIGRGQLADVVNTIAILAHELAHEILLGGGHLTVQVSDHEWVTDLLPVFLGLGIFAANATIQETPWFLRRLGYLPVQVFAYALALFAYLRDESEPRWAEHLRPDALAVLSKGLRFLSKGTDSLVHPDMEAFRRPATNVYDWIARLEHASATVRLSALWDLAKHSSLDAELVEPVARCLDDRDTDIPAEAASTLGEFGPWARDAMPRLAHALWHGEDVLRASAAYALGRLAAVSAELIPELAAHVGDADWNVVCAVSGALRQFGRQAEAAVPKLLPSLKRAIVECNQNLIEDLVWTLLSISKDPARAVCDGFRTDDEARRRSLATLEELRRTSRGAGDARVC